MQAGSIFAPATAVALTVKDVAVAASILKLKVTRVDAGGSKLPSGVPVSAPPVALPA